MFSSIFQGYNKSKFYIAAQGESSDVCDDEDGNDDNDVFIDNYNNSFN